MIASYTRDVMAALRRDGVAAVAVTSRVSEGAARSRITNAAHRLGMRVTTTRQGGRVYGATVDNEAEMWRVVRRDRERDRTRAALAMGLPKTWAIGRRRAWVADGRGNVGEIITYDDGAATLTAFGARMTYTTTDEALRGFMTISKGAYE